MKQSPFTIFDTQIDTRTIPDIPRTRSNISRQNGGYRNRRELRPYRPQRTPRWLPAKRIVTEGVPKSILEGWHSPTTEVAEDLGHTRIPFTYNKPSSVSAVYGLKARRTQYTESAAEALFLRWFTVDTRFTDFQFQPITTTVKTNIRKDRSYTVDALVELQCGMVASGEIKAAPEFFTVQDTGDRLNFFSNAFRAHGLELDIVRWSASAFTDDIAENIKFIYDNQNEGFDPEHVDLVHKAILHDGGTTGLRTVARALPFSSLDSQDILCAMMVKRHIAIDLTRPFCPDLPVTIPPAPVRPGAMRAFQRQFLKNVA
ncbi:MAG: hypothetical protein WA948_12690 [Pontixanthobacter sp.]